MVLAGGEGKRLLPLTNDRAKPAVPFGGTYRIIDFALSNFANARYLKIVVLTQYKSHSLDRHISQTWRFSTLLDNYVTPCQHRCDEAHNGFKAQPMRSIKTSTSSTTSDPIMSQCSEQITSIGWIRARWSTSTSRLEQVSPWPQFLSTVMKPTNSVS